jgi:tetratricopeptide (TPR) repeat protein
MYNDAEDPQESARWAALRERFDWWPRGLAIAFAAKGRRDLYRDPDAPFPWEAVRMASLLDPTLVRDFHTREVLGIYGGLFLKHGLRALAERDPRRAERFFRLAAAVDDDAVEARANLAVALATQGRLDEARALLEALVAEGNADDRVRANLDRVRAAQADAAKGAP